MQTQNEFKLSTGFTRFYRNDVHTGKDVENVADYFGSKFFAPSNKRFFNSRTLETVYKGKYFVTSERYNGNLPRLFTVRKLENNGHIGDCGPFQAYKTRYQALKAAKYVADNDNAFEAWNSILDFMRYTRP